MHVILSKHIHLLPPPPSQRFLETQAAGVKKEGVPQVELMSLDTRSYLDRTVVPILLDAMAVVAKER